MAKILIIDDDDDLVQLLATLLISWGYQVASAGDPATGLEQARAFSPDLMLLDYHMPGSTGAHLFETFRRNRATSQTPIIFMSAVASPDVIFSEIAEPGNARFLPKPVQTAELRRIIAETLTQRR